MRLPDEFWDDFDEEGGWSQFIAAGVVLVLLFASVFAWLFIGAAAQ